MTRREQIKTTYMYFIMSVLVILIHSVNNETRFQLFFSEKGIGQFAVPTFFFLSAFLFFRNVQNIYDIKNKLRKRIYTILIPYLLWNLIYYGINLLLNPGNGISLIDIYNSAFNYAYNPSFWFICQLMLLNVISLLMHYALKKDTYIITFIVAISLLIYLNIDIPYINEDATIYYFFGAVFSKLYNENKIKYIDKKYILPSIVMVVITYGVNRYIHGIIGSSMPLFRLFILSTVYTRLCFVFVLFYILDLIVKYDREFDFMKHTFFLYAMHYMIVKAMIKVMRFSVYIYFPIETFTAIETIAFIVSPIVCVVISSVLSDFLSKKYYKVYKVLTGGRL